MRHVTLALVASACVLSCAAKPKLAAPSAAPPSDPIMRLEADGPTVAFKVPDGWRVLPNKVDSYVTLLRRGREEDMIAVVIQDADPGVLIEEATTVWIAKASKSLKGFRVSDISQPTYASDEESSFLIRGLDEDKQPTVLLCRIRHLGVRTADFWAIILSTAPADDLQTLSEVSEHIVKSLYAQPLPSPK